jgi:hypothetical protein
VTALLLSEMDVGTGTGGPLSPHAATTAAAAASSTVEREWRIEIPERDSRQT